MPSRHTLVRDVGEGVGTKMHRHMGDVPRAAEKTDPLPGLRSRVYHGIDDGTHMEYKWDGGINRLEPVAGQSDRTHSAGL